MAKKLKSGLFDITILLIIPILATIISFIFKSNAFWSVILYFALPSVFLAFRRPKILLKTLLFSAIASIPTIIVVDYIAHATGQWLIPETILPFRLFGYVTLEVVLWAFFNFVVVILFYERFFDSHCSKKLYSKKIKNLIIIVFSLISIFTVLMITDQRLLKIPYFYLVFGIFLVLVPTIRELFSYRGLISKFFITAAYFFFTTFMYEVTALRLDWWRFPSDEFIGWIQVAGVRFPLEELIFWLVLFSMAILTAFERFDDDKEVTYIQ